VRTNVRLGDPYAEIVHYAEAEGVDATFMGTLGGASIRIRTVC
jgi:hypothetical protein